MYVLVHITACFGKLRKEIKMLACQETHNIVSFSTDGQGTLDILYFFSDSTFYLKLSPTL